MRPRPRPRKTPTRWLVCPRRIQVSFNEAAAAAAENPSGARSGRAASWPPFNEAAAAAAENPAGGPVGPAWTGASMRPRPRPRKTPPAARPADCGRSRFNEAAAAAAENPPRFISTGGGHLWLQ